MDLAYTAVSANSTNAVASELDLNQAGRYLDQAVAANPRDLRAHVQRIHFHWRRRQRDPVFAALIDMFVTLEHAGIAIRTRMLRNCEDLLSSDQRVFLLQNLDTGLTNALPLPGDVQTLLYRADADTPAEGDSSENQDDRESVAYLLAQEYIRHGWEDLAKGLLHELVDTDPDNTAARRLLLQLA